MKDVYSLSLSYFDIGFGDVDIRIAASKNVMLEAGDGKLTASDKPAERQTRGR